MLSIALYITLALVVMALLIESLPSDHWPQPARPRTCPGHHVRQLDCTDRAVGAVAEQQNLLRVGAVDRNARFYQHRGGV